MDDRKVMKGTEVAKYQRRLGDLFARGKELTFSDGEGEIKVWLRKLNSADKEVCSAKANATRARVLMFKNDEDSETYQDRLSDVLDMSVEARHEYLIVQMLSEKQPLIEAELRGQEKWSEDNLLQGLEEAWFGSAEEPGFQDFHVRSPEDDDFDAEKYEEAEQIFSKLKVFKEELDKELDAEREKIVQDLASASEEEITKRCVNLFIQRLGDIRWFNEFYRQQMFRAVRELDKKTPYFSTVLEIDGLPDVVIQRLIQEYSDLEVDSVTGKGSPQPEPSSLSSVPPEEGETGADSGLTVAAS